MTLEEAKELRVGQVIAHNTIRLRYGALYKAKVTSIKTWKTRPNDIMIGMKHGMYQFFKIGHGGVQWGCEDSINNWKTHCID